MNVSEIVYGIVAVTSAAAIELDCSKGNIFTCTPEVNITVTVINAKPGQDITLILTQDAVGSRTLTLGTGITNATGATITPTTTASTGKSTYKFVCTAVGATCQLVAALRS